ncbi:preprotein translocase subunit SecE [Melissococcus plutonius]|uniref:Protein translocase subunit SecE n=2 Tax=Melissococcus plutonius TaxID=33970 RepID=F3YCG0_MELPT|nr:preprotein translocase subunit SecE [Melissococcus plutonius]BAL61582.1 preprotein translocase subunit SecE [Melissococcus plutonius DAT561]AIM25384.1 protein translocase subunit SecE [Melissococcus plutonius S1]KMT23750.1 protein translocase subunit SecE [Melissococcus plutonius]KMT24110.1 protein translocase subunit SecE [Melissococcus plutonius]KMT24510.1 protein translocase subunit SecE [Melissococcus plutonius]
MKFLRNVYQEMKKVAWPSKKQLRKDTLIVIETSVIFAVFFFVVDTAIQTVFGWILG